MTTSIPPITLVEIDLDSGTRYYSFEGVVSHIGEATWFSDKIVDIGTIYRDSPLIPGHPRIADTTITIYDPKLLELKASEPFKGREVRIRFGDATDSASIATLYTGEITGYTTDRGAITLSVKDTSFHKLEQSLEGRLNRVDFPSIPTDDSLTLLLPVIYGKLTSEGLWDTGAVPCYRLNDSTPYQYLVARHPCKQILNVYNYEDLMDTADWDARLLLVGDEYYQILEFTADPKAGEPYMSTGRPDEFEITCDVEGKTDSGISGGPLGGLIDTPAAQLRDYLLNYAGISTSELSTAHWLESLTAESQQHKATSFDAGTQRLSLSSTNLLNAEDSIMWNSTGNWATGGGSSAIEQVNLADEGLHTVGLPDGIHTAMKVTVNGTDARTSTLAVTLTAAQHFSSAYILLGSDGWDGGDIQVFLTDLSGVTTGTSVPITPSTDVWQRASQDDTPDAGDLVGALVTYAGSGTPATSGQTFYITGAQVVQEASLSAYQRSSLYSFGDQDFWISIWVRGDALAGGAGDEQIVWRWAGAGSFEWILYYYQTGDQLRFVVSNDGTTQDARSSTVDPQDDTWYHIFAYHSATNDVTGISVNAETMVTGAHTTGVFQGGSQTVLGGTSSTGTWDGDLAHFKAGCAAAGWDISTVSAQTIGDTLYNSGVPLSYDEITTTQKEAWGLNSGLNIYPDRDSNDFTDLHNGVAWTNTGSLSSGDAELSTGGETFRGGAWIGGQDITHLQVIENFSSSFMAPFYTSRTGLFILYQLTTSGIYGLSGDYTEISDELDILRDTFKLSGNREVATDIEYSFSRDWHYDRWQRTYTATDDTGVADLGDGYHSSAVLWYCADLDTANKVMSARMMVSQENQQFAEWHIPPLYHTLELNDILEVTHYQGLGADGYDDEPFRLLGLDISLMPRDANVRAVGARNLDDVAHVDVHTDAHGDASHTDGHGDSAATSTHTDTAHVDTAAVSTHSDTAHSDSAHSDSHGDTAFVDQHGDNHGDATNTGSGVHADAAADDLCPHLDTTSPVVTHIDIHCDEHNDTSHSDSAHSDVTHSDSPHADSHSDSSHGDTAHVDTHGDSGHSDTPHSDVAHSDTEHNDYHADSDTPHTDSSGPHGDHSDVHHADEAA